METEEQIKQYKNSVAEQLSSFSLTVFALALLNKSLDMLGVLAGWQEIVTSHWYYLAYLGVLTFLISVYIIMPNHKAQGWLIRYIYNTIILKVTKRLGWTIVLILLGEGLIKTIQTDWAALLGRICIAAGIAVFAHGIYIIYTSIRSTEEAHNGN